MFSIHPQSKIQFHRLIYNFVPNSKKEYDIVRFDTDDHLKVGVDAIVAISMLTFGKTIQQVANAIGVGNKKVIELVKTLTEFGIVKQIDEEIVNDESEKIKPLLLSINRKLFKWIISKKLLYFYILFAVSGILIGFITPGFIPSYKKFFWTDDLLIVLLSLFILDSFLVFLHELGHFLAIKASGGEARITFSNRSFYLVAETEFYHLGIIPKPLRYFIYLSGMMVDLWIIAFIFWILKLADFNLVNLGIFRNVGFLIILLEIKQIIWQFNIFLETDIYNYFSEFLEQENLRSNTKKFIALRIKNISTIFPLTLKKLAMRFFLDTDTLEFADDLRSFNKNERKHLFLYSLILVFGIFLLLFQLAYYIIPREYVFFKYGFNQLFAYPLQAVLILGILGLKYFGLLIILVKRKRKKKIGNFFQIK